MCRLQSRGYVIVPRAGYTFFFVVFSQFDAFSWNPTLPLFFKKKDGSILYPQKQNHSPQNLMEWKIPTEKRIKKLKHPPKLLLRFIFGRVSHKGKSRKNPREEPSHCGIPPIAILFLMRGPLLERPGISSVCGRW